MHSQSWRISDSHYQMLSSVTGIHNKQTPRYFKRIILCSLLTILQWSKNLYVLRSILGVCSTYQGLRNMTTSIIHFLSYTLMYIHPPCNPISTNMFLVISSLSVIPCHQISHLINQHNDIITRFSKYSTTIFLKHINKTNILNLLPRF
jgi:hypothetical protein